MSFTIEEQKYLDKLKGQNLSPEQAKQKFLEFRAERNSTLNMLNSTTTQINNLGAERKQAIEQKRVREELPVDRQWWDFWLKISEGVSDFWKAIKFKSKDDDGTFMSAAKFIWNLPGNALELVGWVWSVASNPVWTVEGARDLLGWSIQKGMNKLASTETWQNLIRWWREKVWTSAWTEEVLEKIRTEGIYDNERYKNAWDLVWNFTNDFVNSPGKTTKKLLVENPVDVLTTIATGGAAVGAKAGKLAKIADTAWDLSKAQKYQKVANIANKTSQITNPINVMKNIYGKPAEKIFKWAWSTLKTLTSKVSWLNPETLNNLVKHPELFRKAEKWFLTKENLAEKVVKSIDQRIIEVWDLWKKYDTIKNWNWKIDTTGITPRKILEKYDIKVTEKGLDFSSSAIWDTGNMKAIEKAFKIIKSRKLENWKDVLNLRRALDDVINYKTEATDLSKNIVKEMRRNIDNVAKNQIPLLKILDKKYKSEVSELQKIKKYIFSADGSLKDDYIQKISNLTWKWKEKTLERIKKLVPEIEHEINALKALADVKYASWNKVWAYMQTFSWIAWFTAWGIWWAIAWAIISNPNSIKNILLHYGASKKYVSNVMDKVKKGIKLSSSESKTLSNILKSEVIADKLKDFWKDFVPKSSLIPIGSIGKVNDLWKIWNTTIKTDLNYLKDLEKKWFWKVLNENWKDSFVFNWNNWNKFTELLKNWKLPENSYLKIVNTGWILRKFWIEWEIKVTSEMLLKKIKKHNFTLDDIKWLNNAIKQPLLIIDSKTVAWSRVILTKLKHKSSWNNFAVILELRKDWTIMRYENMPSVYPLKIRNIKKAFKENRVLYSSDDFLKNFNSDEELINLVKKFAK